MVYSYDTRDQELFNIECDKHEFRDDEFCRVNIDGGVVHYKETPLLRLLWEEATENGRCPDTCWHCYIGYD